MNDDVTVRQQALLLLNDIMHRREILASALKEGDSSLSPSLPPSPSLYCIYCLIHHIHCIILGIAETLQHLLQDNDWIVRQRTAQVLTIIARMSLYNNNTSSHLRPYHTEHAMGRECFIKLNILKSLSNLVRLEVYTIVM